MRGRPRKSVRKKDFQLLVCLGLWLVSLGGGVRATTEDETLARVRRMVEDVRAVSYPELQNVTIQIKLFDSASDYFQARFTFTSFLLQPRLRYLLKVNRRLFEQPPSDEALRAILAHELEHVLDFKAKARWRLLGLVRMASPQFTARMERRTDVLAIGRGFGAGLKAYREWLYQQIPANKLAEKQRNYFSPDEIEALLRQLQRTPERLQQWLRQPPRSLREIER